MKLVILTNNYPYGEQEAFIEPEMKVFENVFESIHILTLASPNMPVTRYIPKNATVTLVNDGNKKPAFLKLLSPSAIKEMMFVSKKYNYSPRTSVSLVINSYEKWISAFLKHLEKEDTENTVFYSYWLSHFSYALMRFKQKHPEAFCVSRAHRYDNFIDFKASLYRREILSTLDGIYPISLEGKKELENRVLPHINGNCAKLKVFHLGVELSDIINPPEKQEKMKIVSCSFIHKIKRLDIIIDALSKIDDIDIEWTHFGGGQDEVQIMEMAKQKLGSKPNISFDFRGQTAHDDILDYYTKNHVDLFINSSDHEGIPVSIMEAMAAGIICAAREVGGNAELVSDKNGFLLSKNAGADEYAGVIKKAYALDTESLSEMKKCAMLKVREEFASPVMYEKFADEILNSFKNR